MFGGIRQFFESQFSREKLDENAFGRWTGMCEADAAALSLLPFAQSRKRHIGLSLGHASNDVGQTIYLNLAREHSGALTEAEEYSLN